LRRPKLSTRKFSAWKKKNVLIMYIHIYIAKKNAQTIRCDK